MNRETAEAFLRDLEDFKPNMKALYRTVEELNQAKSTIALGISLFDRLPK